MEIRWVLVAGGRRCNRRWRRFRELIQFSRCIGRSGTDRGGMRAINVCDDVRNDIIIQWDSNKYNENTVYIEQKFNTNVMNSLFHEQQLSMSMMIS